MSNWYADGLRFECTQCGNCCTGTPGYVWLSAAEQAEIAAHLELTEDQFRQRYTRLVHGMVSLLEQPGGHGDCILLTEDKRCSIQSSKPRQCLAFPFWPRLLASRGEWKKESIRCPGIGNGPRYLPQEIDAIADRGTPRAIVEKIFRRKQSDSASDSTP